MEIILKEHVAGLGYKNDIVTVKNGYGRNFLIPTGKAVIASESAKKMLAEDLRQRAHKLDGIKKTAEELAAKVNGQTVIIATKVSASGTIFGGVSTAHIAEKLAEKGFQIDRKLIAIKDAVKVLGTYTATILLHKEVSAEVTFEVVAEAAK